MAERFGPEPVAKGAATRWSVGDFQDFQRFKGSLNGILEYIYIWKLLNLVKMLWIALRI